MDKLEKHIKEKLEKRTIVPSEGAWDKIASQIEQKPQNRNKWFSYAIAASIVGIVLVSVFFSAKNDETVEELQVVETGVKEEVEVESGERANSELAPEVETEVAGTQDKSIETGHNKEFKQPTFNTSVAEQKVKEPLQDEIRINSDKLIAQKVEEVVAQVQIMENAKQDVTDAEVDSLLRDAQREILTNKLFANGGSVDAMSLLAEVEDELDESFRDQIFDALKSGYLKIRTAVADRNQ